MLRMLGSGVLQAKLTVSRPDDIHEQEADRVAEEVMRMPGQAADVRIPAGADNTGQVRTKSLGTTSLMPARAEGADAVEVSPSVAGGIRSAAGSGGSLPDSERSFFEPRFGVSFNEVRIHTGAEAADLARSVNAHAFTVGRDVFFGEGRYRPQTEDGKRLIAHELTHTLQQKAGDFSVQRMPACPSRWPDPIPTGWQLYHGPTGVFHCGFRVILENRVPTPDDPQNECAYDHSGALVDEHHPYAGCRGTPNQYDSKDSPFSHTVRDSGGIVHAGGPAFATSRVYEIEQAIAGAIQAVAQPLVTAAKTAANAGRALVDALGRAIVTGILTGRATVDPANWRFQGLPARSIRHLNVIGAILSSLSWSRNLDGLLTNITRRLDSYSIQGLLQEIAEDMNQALKKGNPAAPQFRASDIGALSLLRLVELLHGQGLIQYMRPPEDIAREELDALPKK